MVDRRVRKTKRALAKALTDIVGRKGIEKLTVGELLEAADVGRATFYSHFADKDDFIRLSLSEMIDAADRHSRAHTRAGEIRLVPSLELLAHYHEVKSYVRSLARSGTLAARLTNTEIKLRDVAEDRLAGYPLAPRAPPRAEIAAFVAGAFVGLARAWIERGMAEPPDAVDRAFVALVRGAVAPMLADDAVSG